VPYLWTVRAEETVCTLLAGRPANFEQQKALDKTDRNEVTQELAKNMMNYYLEASSRTVRVVRRQQPKLNLLKVNSTFPLPDLPNQPRYCYQIIGEGEVALGDAIPTNM
jgi:hypothetical protein